MLLIILSLGFWQGSAIACNSRTTASQKASQTANTWVPRVSGFGSTYGFLNAIYGNGLFVAAGQKGALATSPDGVVWTPRTSPSTGFLYGITYGNGKFLLNDYQNGITTSTDGATWTPYLTPIQLSFYTFGFCKDDGYFYGGKSSGIFRSTDGITWTQVHTALSFDVFYAHGLYIACGTGGAISTSTNGTAWTARSSGTTQRLNSIGYGNGVYIIIGYGGAITTTTDGITWTARSCGTTTALWGIAYGRGMFIIADATGVMYRSANGVQWELMTNKPASINLSPDSIGNNLVYSEEHNLFVVVGANGVIYTMQYLPCGDNGDTASTRCYANTGRNESSSAETETECALACSNSGHYGGNTLIGECVLRDCGDRSKNASESEPCGPGDCYWDQGHPTNASKCIDGDTNCSNGDQFTKDPETHECFQDLCVQRLPLESSERKCGRGECFVQPDYTCNETCPSGLFPNGRAECVCPLEHYVSESLPCTYKPNCDDRLYHNNATLACGEGCFYHANYVCSSNPCSPFQSTSSRGECAWLDCDERNAASASALSTSSLSASTASAYSSATSASTSQSFFLHSHTRYSFVDASANANANANANATPNPSRSTSTRIGTSRDTRASAVATLTATLADAPAVTCGGDSTDGDTDPVATCHYLADYAFYASNNPPLTQCTLQCPYNYEQITATHGTYCERVSCTQRSTAFGCGLPAEASSPSCFLNMTNSVCVPECPLHTEPDEDGECQQTNCTGRTAADLGTGTGGTAQLSCVHEDDDSESPCVYFADHADVRFLEEVDGVWRERHTQCLSQCPHNYERLSDVVAGETRYYCQAKACGVRTSETDCTLPNDPSPCHLFNGHCFTTCPFHTTAVTTGIPECIPDDCHSRVPNLDGDGLCRTGPSDECYRMSNTLCAPHCGIHSITGEPTDTGLCTYTNCTARSLESGTCHTPADSAAHACLHFADYALAPFNSTTAIEAGYHRICQLGQCPPNYAVSASTHACERIPCPNRTSANGCYLPGDGTDGNVVCRSFPDAGLYSDGAYSNCVNVCPPNYLDVASFDTARFITLHTCQPLLSCPLRTPSPNCSLIILGDDVNCHVFADSSYFEDSLGNRKAGFTPCVSGCPQNYVEEIDDSTHPYPTKYSCLRQEHCSLRSPVNQDCSLPGDTSSTRCFFDPVTFQCTTWCTENYVGGEETLPDLTIRYVCKPAPCVNRNASAGCALPGDEIGSVPKCFIPPLDPSLSLSLTLSLGSVLTQMDTDIHTRFGANDDGDGGIGGDNPDNETDVEPPIKCLLACPLFSSLATAPAAAAANQCVYSACATRTADATLACGGDACYFFPDYSEYIGGNQCALDCPPNYVKISETNDGVNPPVTTYSCQKQNQCNLRIPINQSCTLPGDTSSTRCYYDPVLNCSNHCSANYEDYEEILSNLTTRHLCRTKNCSSRLAASGCFHGGDGIDGVPKCYTPLHLANCVLDCPDNTEKDEGTRACFALDCAEREAVSASDGASDRHMSCGTDTPECFYVEGASYFEGGTECSLTCPNTNYRKVTEYGDIDDPNEVTGYFCEAKFCYERSPTALGCYLPGDLEGSSEYPPCLLSIDHTGCVTACADFQTANASTHACTAVDCAQRTPNSVGTCGNDSLCYRFSDTEAPVGPWVGYPPCNLNCPPNYVKETLLVGDRPAVVGYVCMAKDCVDRNATEGCTLPVDDGTPSHPTCYVVPAASSFSTPTCSSTCPAFQQPVFTAGAGVVADTNACMWKTCEDRAPVVDTSFDAVVGYTCGVSTDSNSTCYYLPHYTAEGCVATCPPNYEGVAVQGTGGNKLYCRPLPCTSRSFVSGCKLPGDGTEQPICYASPSASGCVSECPTFARPGGADGITCTTQTCNSRSVVRVDDGTGTSVPVCGSEQPPCFYISGNDSCGTFCPQDYGPVERANKNHDLIGYSCEPVFECPPNYVVNDERTGCIGRLCTLRSSMYGCFIPEDDPDTGGCFAYGARCVSECPDGFIKNDSSYLCVSATGFETGNDDRKSKSSSSTTWIVPVVLITVVFVVIAILGNIGAFFCIYKRLGVRNSDSQSNMHTVCEHGDKSGSVSKERRNRELEALEGRVQIADHLHDDNSVSIDANETISKHPIDESMEEEEIEAEVEEED